MFFPFCLFALGLAWLRIRARQANSRNAFVGKDKAEPFASLGGQLDDYSLITGML